MFDVVSASDPKTQGALPLNRGHPAGSPSLKVFLTPPRSDCPSETMFCWVQKICKIFLGLRNPTKLFMRYVPLSLKLNKVQLMLLSQHLITSKPRVASQAMPLKFQVPPTRIELATSPYQALFFPRKKRSPVPPQKKGATRYNLSLEGLPRTRSTGLSYRGTKLINMLCF